MVLLEAEGELLLLFRSQLQVFCKVSKFLVDRLRLYGCVEAADAQRAVPAPLF